MVIGGNLLSGAKNSYIATLVERHSRFALLIKVPSQETESVVAVLSQNGLLLPRESIVFRGVLTATLRRP